MASMSSRTERVICLGNFDGVHLGHRALFEAAQRIARQLKTSGHCDLECAALTFSLPTHNYLERTPPPRITSSGERERLILEAGMQRVIALDFAEIRSMSADQFVHEVLIGQYNCVTAVCGYDYRFGCGGSGDSARLRELMGGHAVTVPPICLDGTAISSTAIRAAVERGDVETAARMLGRPWSLEACVEHGHGMGRGLGFATLNQHFAPGFLVPARGVYVSSCTVNGQCYPAISNVGCRPTFEDGDGVLCETHILDLRADLYGRSIRTELLRFVRPERRFDSAEALSAAVGRDIETARQFFVDRGR